MGQLLLDTIQASIDWWWDADESETGASQKKGAPKPKSVRKVRKGAMGFGPKMAWIAVRMEGRPLDLSASLQAPATPSELPTVLEAIQSNPKAVGEITLRSGWTLVAGVALLPWVSTLIDGGTDSVMPFPGTFPEVQAFLTQDTVESHGWARYVDGQRKRAFAVAEGIEVETDEGTPCADETAALRLYHFDEEEPDDDAPLLPTEETVLELAARWGTDPGDLRPADIVKTTLYMPPS